MSLSSSSNSLLKICSVAALASVCLLTTNINMSGKALLSNENITDSKVNENNGNNEKLFLNENSTANGENKTKTLEQIKKKAGNRKSRKEIKNSKKEQKEFLYSVEELLGQQPSTDSDSKTYRKSKNSSNKNLENTPQPNDSKLKKLRLKSKKGGKSKKENEKENNQKEKKNQRLNEPSIDNITENKLSLSKLVDLDVNLYDTLEFHCDDCPVESINYKNASNHVSEFEHYNMSVVYKSLCDNIKCQSCGDNNLSDLHSILIDSIPISLSLCCNSCLSNAGYDSLIYSFSSKENLLQYVDNMYHIISLKCFRCKSKNELSVDKDLTCFCSKCISEESALKNDNNLIKFTSERFLSVLFDDSRYNEFKNLIHLSDSSALSKPVDDKKVLNDDSKKLNEAKKEDKKKAKKEKKKKEMKEVKEKEKKEEIKERGKKEGKQKVKNDEKRKVGNDEEKKEKEIKNEVEKDANINAKKESKKRADKRENKKNGETSKEGNNSVKKEEGKMNSKKNGKDFRKELTPSGKSKNSEKDLKKSVLTGPATSTPKNVRESTPFKFIREEKDLSLLQGLTADELKVEDKFAKLKQIVKATLPKDIKMNFDDLEDYYHYLTYSLFLEELFSVDLCSDVNFEWYDNTHCKMSGSTKTWFDMYVNDDVHHLKKHPFVRDQPIFIIRKSDMDLNWETEPDFWVTFVSGSKLAKVDRRGRKVNVRAKRNAVVKKSNQHSTFNLELYPWNKNKLPVAQKGDQFAFMPASNVLGRILNSMNKIENKDFINLILGKKPIKRINFNNNLQKSFNVLNDSQKAALQSAFNNTVTILQGPPGSGKTSTIYEIILQLLENLHYYPILVVAASNLAVDNIAEKLMPKYSDIILRITSLSKEKEYGEDHPLGSVCLHNKISQILPPNLQDIERRLKRNFSSISSAEFGKYLDTCSKSGLQLVKQASIIFATTAGIAGPYLKNIKEMPVIIMDEATQSSEPSTLIPLGANGCKKVILVGDTAQLSVFTRVKSLEMSLFQRVLENGTYSDPLMLDTQYRMHPDISEFSRKKFYDNKLKDGITAVDRKKPTIKYPVFFYDHKGIGAMESKEFSVSGEEFGFSWVNKQEVKYIERMVEKLIVDHHVTPSSIGVMTGYAAQRDLIVKSLENNVLINPNHHKTNRSVDKEDLSEKKNVTVCNVNGIIIATIDAFQGREMDFVLLSTVRSNIKNNIGFMSDKRRMNVALTRAKYSFIICGNASCLSSNKLWGEYINDLQEKNYVKSSLNDY